MSYSHKHRGGGSGGRPGDPRDHAGKIREAGLWLDHHFRGKTVPPLLVVIGLGEGHLLDALASRAPRTRVLALEPDPATAQAFLRRRDLETWRSSGRLTYLVGPAYTGANDAWRLVPSGGDQFALLTHPGLNGGEAVATAARLVSRIVFGARANEEARRRFAPRYLRNVLRNVPAMLDGRDVRALASAYAGVPAVITAAGPSLDSSLDELRTASTGALLIATDTTLRPLLSAGIVPHLAVGADPGEANARHFLDLPAFTGTWLVAESALDPIAAVPFHGRTLWFRLANHHPWPWLREGGLDVGHVEMWGSVLTAAFGVACLAGCDPIVIAGADLAFTDGRPYCRGTTYEFDWAHAVAGGVPLDDVWRAQMARSKQVQMQDLRGRDTVTTPALLSFRDWLLSRASRSGRRIINATGAGILVGEGVEQMPLARTSRAGAVRPVEDAVRTFPHPVRDIRESLAAHLGAARKALAGGAPFGPPGDAWQAFSGEGFDAASLASTIDEAAGRCSPSAFAGDTAACRRDGAGRAALTPWRGSSLFHLAESTARLTAFLRGHVPASDAEPEEPLTPLVEGLALLQPICDEALRLDPARAAEHLNASDTPVAVAYAWPEPLRWAVQRFEALLGDACRNAAARPAPSWFPRGTIPADSSAARTRGAASRACLQLAREWMQCAALRATDTALYTLAERVAALEQEDDTGGGPSEELVLRLDARDGDLSASLALPLKTTVTGASRALTGTLRRPGDSWIALARLDREDTSITGAIGTGDCPSGGVPPAPFRELTGTGPDRGVIAYATPAGAVCVQPYSDESLLIRADGTIVPHLRWPRPIVGELPFGNGGAVAWDNGMHGAGKNTACVMYRDRPEGRVVIEDIPVRPTTGVWWKGRLYWSCFPTPSDTWVGLASWAPGDEVVREMPDITLFGMHAVPEGLRLDPCVFRPHAGHVRQRVSDGWIWNRGTAVPLALGPYGAMSAVEPDRIWTARAYPESNLVQLDSANGAVLLLACHYPLRLAWVGRGLLVSTVDRHVLLFDNLEAHLDDAAEKYRSAA